MNQRRVLFINRSYWPDCEATGQLLTELCEDLAERFHVSVICGQPNGNPQQDEYRSAGTEIRNNVCITRVRHTRFDKAKRRRWRVLNMLTFACAATWVSLFRRRDDIVVVETDPPFLCLLGYVIKLLRGSKLVVYLQDIYPDVAEALGQLPSWFPTRSMKRLFVFIYSKSDAIVVLSEDMRRLLCRQGIQREKISVIPNWVDSSLIEPQKNANLFREEHGISNEFVVMYSGNLGLSQRFEDVLEVARRLPDVMFLMVGGGARRVDLEREAANSNLGNVRFFPYQPKSLLAHSLSAADLHLVLLAPELTEVLMPSKLYSVLASGTPVLALASPESELAQLVTRENVGFVCSSGSPDEIEDAIRCAASSPALREDQAQNARELAETQFDRQIVTNRFKKLLRGLLPTKSSSVGLAANDIR